jgi:hypothetical protein
MSQARKKGRLHVIVGLRCCMTNCNEMIIIRTCVALLVEIIEKDKKSNTAGKCKKQETNIGE